MGEEASVVYFARGPFSPAKRSVVLQQAASILAPSIHDSTRLISRILMGPLTQLDRSGTLFKQERRLPMKSAGHAGRNAGCHDGLSWREVEKD